jgi:hypothetical protein
MKLFQATVLILAVILPARGVPAHAAAAEQAPSDEAGIQSGAGEAGVDGPRVGVYRGTVTNRKNGKAVAGAVVIFLNEASGESYQRTTGDDGGYEIQLPEGDYIVDIQVGRKVYRSSGTFREEADGRRWVMDFTIGSRLTEQDLKIATTATDVRLIPTEPRPPLEPSRKLKEFLIFLGGVLGVAALSN